MENPLLEIDALPAFDRIEARHARPALEQVLAENRARLAELTAQPEPTFASLVVPVEELSYRLSRVWSPIGHLNAVANSDGDARGLQRLRAAAHRLFLGARPERGAAGGVRARAAHRGRKRSTRHSASCSRTRCAIFVSPVSICRPIAKRATARWCSGSRTWRPSSPRTCSMPRAPITRTSPTSAELAGLPANAVDRAAADARESRDAAAGCSSSISRPT